MQKKILKALSRNKNETLWEELEMTKSRKRTFKEKAYRLKELMVSTAGPTSEIY